MTGATVRMKGQGQCREAHQVEPVLLEKFTFHDLRAKDRCLRPWRAGQIARIRNTPVT